MALKEKLDAEDFALLEVLEDPVWFSEFMRSTRDGSIQRDTWPKKPFSYRWYQRDILTDQNRNVVLRGGRAIGKCQSVSARVYTTEGYKTIGQLKKEPYFITYALNAEGEYVQSRAIIQPDLETNTFKITLANGNITYATANHPFLTPDGYKMLGDIKVGDSVAVTTFLPWEQPNNALRWHELRLLGYTLLNEHWPLQRPLYPRTTHIKKELAYIADLCDLMFTEGKDFVLLQRRNGKGRNPISQLYYDLGLRYFLRNVGHVESIQRHIPKTLMLEKKENIQIFLEALFAQFAHITKKRVAIACDTLRFALNLQELLLRFGIESLIEDGNVVALRDQRAIYRMFNQFQLPGISMGENDIPAASLDPSPIYRYEYVESITPHLNEVTYAIYVYDHHNYIADHMLVHNSLVLEDAFLYETLNQDIEFPETKESLLTTANQSQIEPVAGRLITRSTISPLLKEFIGNRVNRSLGILDFRFGDTQFLMRMRIAGTNGQSNMVGLHLPRIRIDEAQLFTEDAFTQLRPALNTWESKVRVFICGVNR